MKQINMLVVVFVMMVGLSACSETSDSDPAEPADPAVEAPVIDTFSSSKSTIGPGESVTLSWTLSGGEASSLEIDEVGEVSGSSVSVTPEATTTYTLTASNDAGSDTATAQVTVSDSDDAPTRLSGEYEESLVMRSSETYLIEDDVTFTAGTTLTIEAGAVVKFNARTGTYNNGGPTGDTDLTIDGTLNALGTAESPIIFTSSYDDSAGGDTNEDGSDSTPALENWGEVFLRSGATGNIAFAEFRYANRGIDIEGANLTADTVTVQDSRVAIRTSANDSPTVTNLSTARVEFGGVAVSGGQASQDVTWGLGNAPVIIVDDLVIANNATLTVEPGTVVKFNAETGTYNNGGPTGDTDLTVDGTLNIRGTADSPVIFTSSYDDSAGGDSNGDGSARVPELEDWGEVLLQANATGNVAFAEFRYAVRGIDVEGASLTAGNVTVQDSATAIRTSANDSPTVTNLSTVRVEFGGVAVSGGQASQNVTWGLGDAPVIVLDDLVIASSSTLTIQPGTVVKFNANRGTYNNDDPTTYTDLTVEGSFVANGTVDAPIVLTSSYDDSAGGDTNGDGSNETPAASDWGTILFQAGSTSSVSNVDVRYSHIEPNFPSTP